MRVDIGRECPGFADGFCRFWQISTELQPLIDVRNLFSLSLAFLYRFSSNLV